MKNLSRVEKAFNQKFKNELTASEFHVLFPAESNGDPNFLKKEQLE